MKPPVALTHWAIALGLIAGLSGCATGRPTPIQGAPVAMPDQPAATTPAPEPRPTTTPAGRPSGTRSEKAPAARQPSESETGSAPGPVETGTASWYGKAHHGKTTANGETYDMNKLTAAHPTLPLGSRAVVTNVENGKSVEVRINDRGPTIAGRIIDLSYAAARRLGGVIDGTFPVRVKPVDKAAKATATGDSGGARTQTREVREATCQGDACGASPSASGARPPSASPNAP